METIKENALEISDFLEVHYAAFIQNMENRGVANAEAVAEEIVKALENL